MSRMRQEDTGGPGELRVRGGPGGMVAMDLFPLEIPVTGRDQVGLALPPLTSGGPARLLHPAPGQPAALPVVSELQAYRLQVMAGSTSCTCHRVNLSGGAHFIL